MGGPALLRTVAGVIVLLQLITGAFGWGKDGHYAICKIAEGFLNEDTVATVKDLLPAYAEGDLATVCSWADQVRRSYRYRWSGPLHYINTPEKCNYNYARDCHDTAGHKDVCVAGAVFNYTRQLTPASDVSFKLIKDYNQTEALLFLSHFIGDVHQPLHCGFEDDEGGNTVEVRWYRRKSNLHHVWDSDIIETALKTYYEENLDNMIEAIKKNITGDWSRERSAWETCRDRQLACPNAYASESINLACKFAYKDVEAGITLEDNYFLSRLPVIEKRIGQAGVRLAATLNRIFSSEKYNTRA